MTLKYPDGTKLLYIGSTDTRFINGKVYTIRSSKNYTDAYRFDEEGRDPGWISSFVENNKLWIIASLRERLKDVI